MEKRRMIAALLGLPLLAGVVLLAAGGQGQVERTCALEAGLPLSGLSSFTPDLAPVAAAPREDTEFPATTGVEEFQATAYCDDGLTRSGILVRRGIIAADPVVLPIGSVVELSAGDYSGIYTVLDTGKLVKGKIVDIYVPDWEEAVRFGRQTIRLRVLRWGWLPEGSSSGYSLAG